MKNLRKIAVITAVFAFLAQAPASAFTGAILKGVKIDLLGNKNYQVTIKTDKDVPIKKYVTAANQVVLDLRNIRPAQYVSAVYNGAAEVDHVVIQPSSGDKMRIFFQGLNMASSKVILDTRDESLGFLYQKPVITQDEMYLKMREASQKINNEQIQPIFIDLSDKKASNMIVNKPIDKIKSVTPILSYEERIGNNLQNVKNSMKTGVSAGSIFNASPFDWGLRLLTLAAILAAGIKWFRRPKKVEINLASENMKNREMDLYKSAESQKERLTKSLGMLRNKESAAKKPNYSSISQYGLKEYQNSQLPPRKLNNQPLPERSKFTSRTRPQVPVSKNVQKQNNVKPLAPTKVARKQTEAAKKDFDGVKFLETMASIYQKSGRDDLASGIRQNIISKQKAV